ncbi:MAG: 2-oxo acid dehydrogenase subunit E2, partial [Actinomycetes bacterium]
QASTFVRHPAAAAPVTARVEASPFARRRAAELGVDLAGVNGSGPGGAITVADGEAWPAPPSTSAPPPAPPHPAARRKKADVAAAPGAAGDAAQRAAAMRTAIGQLMARSKREIPHYYLQTTVDLSALTDWLERRNAGRPVADRLLPVAALLKASALAARAVPEVNGFFLDGAFRRADHVHLGVAVSLRGGGLVAPAIHDADLLGLEELMAALKDLVARARAGRLRGSEMSDPTLTVTNLGDQGAELVHGVIYPPQVALVGLGRVVERPWAVDRMLTVRPVVTATLAADHRVTDGHRGGLYLAALAAALQKPEEL